MKTGCYPKNKKLKLLRKVGTGKKKEPEKKPVKSDYVLGMPKNLPSTVREHLLKSRAFLVAEGRSQKQWQATWTRYCNYCKLFYEINKEISKTGYSTLDEKGLLRKNPLFAPLKDASTMCLKLEETLGLTPLSQSKVPAAPVKDEDDPAAKFVGGRKK
jgi:P27 family predicted phage terminase small subunit